MYVRRNSFSLNKKIYKNKLLAQAGALMQPLSRYQRIE